MALSAREITRDDLNKILALSLLPEQRHLVADNARTVAQAAYETGSIIYGLWEGHEPIGLMAVIKMPDYPWPDPEDDVNSLYLWRLMIDKNHQGKGHGTAALDLLVALAREWGLPCVTSSVVDSDNSGMGFYEKYGFEQTGVVHDGELVIRLTV